MLARIPTPKRQTDFDFSNAAPAAWQAWSTSTAEEFGALVDIDAMPKSMSVIEFGLVQWFNG